MRTFANYNDIFHEILSKTSGTRQIYLSQYEEGNDPKFIDENGKQSRPYEPTDTFITYRFNSISSYIVNDEARVYYDLHINVIGEDSDMMVNTIKLRLEKQDMLEYYALNNIGIETTNVPVVSSNVEINRKWFNRRMMKIRFNFIEKIEEELEYFENLNDINIEEVR